MLISCNECGKQVSDQAQSCPNCGAPIYSQTQYNQYVPLRQFPKKKKSKGVLAGFISFSLVIAAMLIVSQMQRSQDDKTNTIPAIENAEQFSRISESELLKIMGSPGNIESWTNKTSKGDFPVKTISYDKNSNHYEFIIFEDSDIRFTAYSSKHWTGKGDDFLFSRIDKLPELFGIDVNSDQHKVNNTGYAYVVSPVNGKVAEFHVFGINSKEKTFEMAKITYDTRYFD